MTTLDQQQIEQRIPHRPPMLLVDQVLELEADRVVCRKHFRGDEFFFQGHYPGNPLVPGLILCEAAAQAGAILAGSSGTGSGTPVLTRVRDVRFRQVVRPGDTINIEVRLEERAANALFFAARIAVEGRAACQLNFAVMVSEKV